MKVTESDLYEDKKKFEQEKEKLKDKIIHTNNYDLFVQVKHRIDILDALINYIDKIVGD